MTTSSKKNKKVSKRIKTTLFQKLGVFGLLCMILLSFQQCANMQRPTGGPKDSLPPIVLEEYPQNFTTNFTERQITITFDEFVKLNSHQKEFSVSPDLETPMMPKIRRRNLIMELPDSLEENTTYTINLGRGLVDFNESNPILNYTYVFSTGPELDSLSISGNVTNGYTKTFDPDKDKDINVILIPTSRDSIFGKRKASIFTTVDTSGNFKLNNLREDSYRIYAIKEQNNDRIYNGIDEWIGFLDDSIYLDRDISGIHLELSRGYQQEFRVLDRKIESSGIALLTFNKPIDNPSIHILDQTELNEAKIDKFSAHNDSVQVFLPHLDFDSIRFEIVDNQQVMDTILIRKPRNLKLDRSIAPTFNISNKVDRIKHIRLTSSTPIQSVDKNKVQLMEDSVSRRNFQLQQDTIDTNIYHIRYNWRPKRNYELLLEEGAIRGFFDETNEETKQTFTYDETENYGDIEITFTGMDNSQQYIVEVISEDKEKVFDKKILPNNHVMSYNNFPTGKYSIRIIWDRNRNARWDPADVWTGTKQENIWYLDRTFTIRANWEQNETAEVKFE